MKRSKSGTEKAAPTLARPTLLSGSLRPEAVYELLN